MLIKPENTDQSNTWLYVGSSHHMLYFRSGTDAERDIKILTEIHESAYQEITKRLLISDRPEVFSVYIYTKSNEKQIEGTVGNVYRREINVLYNEERKKVYAGYHEEVHAIINTHWGDLSAVWAEGIATFLSSDHKRHYDWYAAEILFSGQWRSLTQILDEEIFHALPGVDAYNQAASLIAFINEHFGWEKLVKLLKQISTNNKKQNEQISLVLNETVNTLDEAWTERVALYLEQHRSEIEDWRPLWSAQRKMFYEKYKDALIDLHSSLAKNNNDPYVHYLTGICYFMHNDYSSAKISFLRATELPLLRSEDGVAHRRSYLFLGKISDILEKRNMALTWYNKVLSMPEYDGTHDEIRALLKLA